MGTTPLQPLLWNVWPTSGPESCYYLFNRKKRWNLGCGCYVYPSGKGNSYKDVKFGPEHCGVRSRTSALFRLSCCISFVNNSRLHKITFLELLNILLEFKRKASGQASCKSQQLPWGGRWRRESTKAMLFELSRHEGQPLGRKGVFKRVEPKVLGKACFQKRKRK